MRKLNAPYKFLICVLAFLLLALGGCSKQSDSSADKRPVEIQEIQEKTWPEDSAINEISQQVKAIVDEVQEQNTEPIIAEVDWSDYFDEINGAAVIYDPTEKCYQIYNQLKLPTPIGVMNLEKSIL